MTKMIAKPLMAGISKPVSQLTLGTASYCWTGHLKRVGVVRQSRFARFDG